MNLLRKVGLPLLLILTLLGACGGASSSAPSTSPNAPAMDSKSNFGQAAEESRSPDVEFSADSAGESRLQNAKLIYTADLEVETMDYTTAAADLEDLVKQLGGYFEQASVNNSGGGRRYGSYTVRLPSAQFHAFCKQVGVVCHVSYQNSREENIGEVYYDTELRLSTQKTKLERLQTLLAKAELLVDIITLESAISETELAIEQLSGTLRSYDLLVDFATVNINISEVYKLSSSGESQPAEGFLVRLATALSGGWHSFVSGVENLLVGLAYCWMWVVPVVVASALVLRRLLRQRKMPKPSPGEGAPKNSKDMLN